MQMLGHDGPPTLWKENLLTGKKLERCPVRSIQLAPSAVTAEVSRYVDEYYPAYVDGHLLVEGGIAGQPARYLAYMREIKSLETKVELKLHELTRGNQAPPPESQ